jgi:signal transduction histidine kinase
MVSLAAKEGLKVKVMNKKAVQKEKLPPLDLLVSIIAHEIKNLNNCVTFNTPILKEYLKKLIPIIDDYARNHQNLDFFGMTYVEFRKDIFNLVNNLETASSRINEIISDLMEFVKNGYKGALCWVDLNQVVEKGIAVCQSRISKRVKSFDVNISENLPQVYTDPKALEQILVNFLINAAQAADKLVNFLINAAQAADKENSWVKLSVKLGKGKWRDHLIIEVSDNGCGMDIATREKIFDPFFTTKASGEGTGLGLFVTNSLVEVLGACIEVESGPGKGSAFRIILRKGNPSSRKDYTRVECRASSLWISAHQLLENSKLSIDGINSCLLGISLIKMSPPPIYKSDKFRDKSMKDKLPLPFNFPYDLTTRLIVSKAN